MVVDVLIGAAMQSPLCGGVALSRAGARCEGWVLAFERQSSQSNGDMLRRFSHMIGGSVKC